MRYVLILIALLYCVPAHATTLTEVVASAVFDNNGFGYTVSGSAEGLSFATWDLGGFPTSAPFAILPGQEFTISVPLLSYARFAMLNGEEGAVQNPFPLSYTNAQISVAGTVPLDAPPNVFMLPSVGRILGSMQFVGVNGTNEVFDYDVLLDVTVRLAPLVVNPLDPMRYTTMAFYGQTPDLSTQPVTVTPEPATLWLLAPAAVWLITRQRRLLLY